MRFSQGRALIAATAVLAGVAGAGCKVRDPNAGASAVKGANDDTKFGWDVNDVSYLFPITPQGEPIPKLDIARFFPQSIFDDVTKLADDRTPKKNGAQFGIAFNNGEESLQNWRIYSFRYDPCASSLDVAKGASSQHAADTKKFLQTLNAIQGSKDAVPDIKCAQEIRFIAQPIDRNGNGTADFAAHLVYEIGEGVPASDDKVIAILDKLKRSPNNVDTNGLPLQVHPGLMAKAEFQSEVAAAVNQIIALPGAHLANVAFMGLENGSFEPWVFFATVPQGPNFGVVPQPSSVATNPRALSFSIKLSFISPENVLPKSQFPVSTADLFKIPQRQAANTNDPVIQSAAKTLFEIDDPRKSHFFNKDCVSCHTTTSRILDLKIQANAADRFPTPDGITGFARRDNLQFRGGQSWNIRNFGYFGQMPSIALRTVTETAAVADFVNSKILAKPNPGISYASCQGGEPAVWQCFLDGKRSDCTAACTSGPKIARNEPTDITVVDDKPIAPPVTPDLNAGDKLRGANFALTRLNPPKSGTMVKVSFRPGCDGPFSGNLFVNGQEFTCDNCTQDRPDVLTNGPWEFGFGGQEVVVRQVGANLTTGLGSDGKACEYDIAVEGGTKPTQPTQPLQPVSAISLKGSSQIVNQGGLSFAKPVETRLTRRTEGSEVDVSFSGGNKCNEVWRKNPPNPLDPTQNMRIVFVNGQPFTCDNCNGAADRSGPWQFGLGQRMNISSVAAGLINNNGCVFNITVR